MGRNQLLLNSESRNPAFIVFKFQSSILSQVDFVADSCSSEHCTLVFTGYLRACCLSVNQLVTSSASIVDLLHDICQRLSFLDQVHVTGAGDFQLHKIELLKDPCILNVQKGGDFMDSEGINDAKVCH